VGRHSAPDDDDEVVGYAAAGSPALVAARPAPGMHGAPQQGQHGQPGQLNGAVPQRSAAADLALLRSSPALRARCIAAVVVPVGIFIALMIVMGQGRDFLLWLWVPTVVSGMLVGLFLDLAHRHHVP
jgi:hypothetical protein